MPEEPGGCAKESTRTFVSPHFLFLLSVPYFTFAAETSIPLLTSASHGVGREGADGFDGGLAGKQHHQAIDAEGVAARTRHAVLERTQKLLG